MVNVDKINKQIEDVREFMTTFGQEIPDKPTYKNLKFRLGLIREEQTETLNSTNFLEYFDGCLDTLYVVHGTFLSLGIRGSLTELDFVSPYTNPYDPLEEMRISDEENILEIVKIWENNCFCDDKSWSEDIEEKFLEEVFEKSQYSLHHFLSSIIYSIHERFSGKSEEFLDKGWKCVHESNMSKLFEESEIVNIPKEWTCVKTDLGYVVKNQYGKVMKSPSYKPATDGLKEILIGL